MAMIAHVCPRCHHLADAHGTVVSIDGERTVTSCSLNWCRPCRGQEAQLSYPRLVKTFDRLGREQSRIIPPGTSRADSPLKLDHCACDECQALYRELEQAA